MFRPQSTCYCPTDADWYEYRADGDYSREGSDDADLY